MIKKILSYLYPITIYKKSSSISKSIEVVLYNGQLLVDTPNTNYSYGSLQRILRFGLKKIGFHTIQKMNHILVLGIAGGSVIKTLVNEVKFTNKIVAVDIDQEIVTIAKRFFKLDEIQNLEIVINDAQDFVFQTDTKFDLIVVDIFQDNYMPDFLFSEKFLNQLSKILTSKGLVMFNTMKNSVLEKERNQKLFEYSKEKYSVMIFPNVEGNELFIFEKLK